MIDTLRIEKRAVFDRSFLYRAKGKNMKHSQTIIDSVEPRRSPYTHLIWDFNGTVLDDVRLGIDCVNTMLAKRGLPILPDEESYRRVFGFPIDAYYRRLGFDFEKEDYDTVLAPEWVALYLAGENTCTVREGVTATIAAVRARGVRQIMLSASNRTQLEAQLARLGLKQEFEEILGLDNIHARSKKALAMEWKERNPTACPLFVGDTEHDADVADAIGADCILLSGGHQHQERLSARGKIVVSSVTDLLAYI